MARPAGVEPAGFRGGNPDTRGVYRSSTGAPSARDAHTARRNGAPGGNRTHGWDFAQAASETAMSPLHHWSRVAENLGIEPSIRSERKPAFQAGVAPCNTNSEMVGGEGVAPPSPEGSCFTDRHGLLTSRNPPEFWEKWCPGWDLHPQLCRSAEPGFEAGAYTFRPPGRLFEAAVSKRAGHGQATSGRERCVGMLVQAPEASQKRRGSRTFVGEPLEFAMGVRLQKAPAKKQE